MEARVRISEEGIDLSGEIERVEQAAGQAGAVVSFTGRVRGEEGQAAVTWLEIEHYPGMTERSVAAVAAEAARRWPLQALTVIHRVGQLAPGERIVLVVTASRHRQDAFAAARFVMDYLKTRAVFWKREIRPDGARWIESRDDDHAAAAAWQHGAS